MSRSPNVSVPIPDPARRRRLRAVGVLLISLLLLISGAITAHADLAESHSFTGWTNYTDGDADVTITADQSTEHSGAASIKINNATPRAGNVYGGVVQTVPVTAGTTYEFSAWVKGDSLPGATSAQLVLSPDWNTRQSLPNGTYDWQQVTWEYTTLSTQTTMNYRLILQDTGTVWLDDLSITAKGADTNLITNPGFEDFSTDPPVADATLDVTNSDLMFTDTSSPKITLKSNRPSVDWVLTDDSGQPVDNGSSALTNGSGSFSLAKLPYGYYNLELTTAGPEPITRTTSLAILTAQNDKAQAGSRFGVSWHASELTDDQLATMDKLGVGEVRFDVSWGSVEKTKGVYAIPDSIQQRFDDLVEMGLRPLVILDYRNSLYDDGKTPSTTEGIAAFAAYGAFVAEHFGTAADYEVYNEFNGTGFNDGLCGTTADCYFQLLKPTYQAIHQVVGDATVVGPVLAGIDTDWLKRLFELGGLDYLDAVSVHTYAGTSAPEGITSPQISATEKLIKQYNDGESKPLWLTETGWSTNTTGVTEDQHADFLVRDMVLNAEAGLDREYWYDLVEDGPDATNREHRFGLIRNVNSGLTTAAPKPSYVTYSVLTRELAGYQPVKLETLATGAYEGIFANKAGKQVRVLWATSAQAVDVTTTGKITVTDRFGSATSENPADGSLQLDLTEHPIYLSGAVSDVAVPASATYLADITKVAPAGEAMDVTVKVDHRGQTDVDPGTVTFATADGAQKVLVPSVAGRLKKATLSIPTSTETGSREVLINVSIGGKMVARISGQVTIVDNQATVTFDPQFNGDAAEPVITVTNHSDSTDLTVKKAVATIGSEKAVVKKKIPVPAGGSVDVPIAATDTQLWQPYQVKTAVTFADGVVRKATGPTAFAPVYPDGTAAPPEADLRSQGTVVDLTPEGIGGSADLSGSMWVSSGTDTVTLHAVVTDDQQHSADDPALLWNDDSVQFAFAPLGATASTGRSEFGAALQGDGSTAVYDFSGSEGVVTEADAQIARDDQSHTTTYAITLPKDRIGLGADDAGVDFSFLVNDNDGNSRAGYLQWASGIGKTKDPSQFLPITFVQG